MTRIVWICDVVLMHRLCHRTRYNLLHRRNIYVQIFLPAEIIEFSAGACISISLVVNSKTSLAFIFNLLRLPGNSTFTKSHTRLAAAMSSAEPQPPSLPPVFWYRMCACTYELYCIILISLLSDRNHIEDRLNVPANVSGWHDRNCNRLSIMDKRILQVILSSFVLCIISFP